MQLHKCVPLKVLPIFLVFLFASISAVSASSPLHGFLGIRSASDDQVQGAIWSHTYGGFLGDFCFDMIEVSTGGFAMTGYKDMDWTVHMGVLWIVRTDGDGIQLWNRTYTDHWSWGHSILECNDGGFLVAGKLVTDQPQIWLVRTDSNGNHLWNRTYGGVQPAVGYVVSEVVECAEGGYAIFGSGPDINSGNSDYYLVRTDANGNPLWNHTYDHGWMDSPAEKGLVQCSDGGFAMVGYRRDSAWQTPYSDVWLVRTDSAGNQVWNKTYGGSDAEFPTDIARVDSDFLILLGVIGSDPGPEGSIIRVDAEGNTVFDRRSRTIIGTSMVQCSNGGFAVVGVTQQYPRATGETSLARIDDDCYPLWERIYNRTGGGFLTIIECSNGNFAMAGSADDDFWLLRVADQAPVSLIGWIAVGIGVPVAVIAVVAILRTKRKRD